VSDELGRAALAAVATRYGLGEPEYGGRLQGGYANDLIRFRAGGRDWVARVLLPPLDERGLAWEHALPARLARLVPLVPVPEPARDGGTWVRVGDRAMSVMPLVAGMPADPRRKAHRLAAAGALGRLHAAGGQLELAERVGAPALPQMEWPELAVRPALGDHAARIAAERRWAIDRVASIAAGRRPQTGLVHGDFFPGNVLVDDDDAASGVIDWDESRLDWLSWDLANAIGTFCTARDDVDGAAAREFLAAYRAAGGTAPRDEEGLLVPLMRVKRILEVLRAPTDGEPRWDHQRHNLRVLERLPGGP
jgi:Ser/Thr protein kinase RdoA (MazF antagonist)